MTTVASGFCTSAPAEVDKAIGRKPSEATAAVRITGRNRSAVARNTRSRTFSTPSAASSLRLAISTMPLSTATPNRAIKPTPAEMLKGMPRSHSASTPPIVASGMPVKISAACFTERNER